MFNIETTQCPLNFRSCFNIVKVVSGKQKLIFHQSLYFQKKKKHFAYWIKNKIFWNLNKKKSEDMLMFVLDVMTFQINCRFDNVWAWKWCTRDSQQKRESFFYINCHVNAFRNLSVAFFLINMFWYGRFVNFCEGGFVCWKLIYWSVSCEIFGIWNWRRYYGQLGKSEILRCWSLVLFLILQNSTLDSTFYRTYFWLHHCLVRNHSVAFNQRLGVS